MNEIGFRAGYFEISPISNLDLRLMIPQFTCLSCGNGALDSSVGYPKVDPAEILDKYQMRQLQVARRSDWKNEEMLAIVAAIESRWHIPVTAGSHFLPVKIRVTGKPKVDFDVLPNHGGIFCKRSAAERLRAEGFALTWVTADASGKHALAADFVQLALPVVQTGLTVPDHTFCNVCHRWSPSKPKLPVREVNMPVCPHDVFMHLERGIIIFSANFISSVCELGLTGLVEGKTLHSLIHSGTAATATPTP